MIFKSVFGRLLTTYLIITVLVVATLSLVVSSLYKEAVFNEKRTNLEATAKRVGLLTEQFINNDIGAQELSASIDAMGYSTDAIIYSLKISRAQFLENQGVNLEGLNDAFVPGDIIKILNGETVFRNRQYSKDFGTYVLFTGYPLRANGSIIGAILVFCPINDIDRNISNMNFTIWLAALLAIIASIPFIYMNSRHISRPIKEIEKAAKQIAAGEKAEDTQIVSEDEIGKLSKSFNMMKDQIEKTERTRRELIANISHDLRTPLTSINGFVQGMLDGIVKPEEQMSYLRIIQEETNRLINLTSDILDLAKIESGSLSLKVECVNIRQITGSVLSSIQLKARERGIRISCNIDSQIRALADEARLKQILANILSNALKYSQMGGLIQIEAEYQEQMVLISIKDHGIGISKDDLPFIFEKFFRADRSRRTEDESSGLGLSIVKNLVILNGGSIKVESELGEGTTIKFSLPKA